MSQFEPKVDLDDAGLRGLSNLTPDDEFRILQPAAARLVEAMKETIRTRFAQITKQLADSVRADRRAGRGAGYILVYPRGTHHEYNHITGSGQKMRKKATAAEVAFVLEYGRKGVPATHWMEQTITAQQDAMSADMQSALDEIISERTGT